MKSKKTKFLQGASSFLSDMDERTTTAYETGKAQDSEDFSSQITESLKAVLRASQIKKLQKKSLKSLEKQREREVEQESKPIGTVLFFYLLFMLVLAFLSFLHFEQNLVTMTLEQAMSFDSPLIDP